MTTKQVAENAAMNSWIRNAAGAVQLAPLPGRG